MSEEVQFVDAENAAPGMKERLTFKDIILRRVEKIAQLGSVEFRGGHYEVREIQTANSTNVYKHYVPDSRAEYFNAVENLSDMLVPYFDKEMTTAQSKYDKGVEAAFEKYSELVEPNDETPFLKKAEHFIISDEAKNLNKNAKRLAAQKLFRALCSFLYRKKYLELGEVSD